MEEYYRNYFEGQPELNGKTGNRILCVTTVVMIGIQFLMIFMGIYDTLPLVLGTQLSVLLIPIIGALISGVDVKETFKLRPISFKMVVFSFLIILCSYPIVALLNLVSMLFVENAVVGTAAGLYNHGFIVSILVMAVCPAIGEEFLMRGVVYRSYQKKSPKLALVLSAVIFGLLHMNFNQMPYAIYLGLIMVLMMEASDSIVTPMLMHFFMNGISTLSGFFSEDTLEDMSGAAYNVENVLVSGDEMKYAFVSVGILAAIMIPLVILIIKAAFRVNGRKMSEVFEKKEPAYSRYTLPEVDDGENIVDVWLIIALLIMFVMTALNTFM